MYTTIDHINVLQMKMSVYAEWQYSGSFDRTGMNPFLMHSRAVFGWHCCEVQIPRTIQFRSIGKISRFSQTGKCSPTRLVCECNTSSIVVVIIIIATGVPLWILFFMDLNKSLRARILVIMLLYGNDLGLNESSRFIHRARTQEKLTN